MIEGNTGDVVALPDNGHPPSGLPLLSVNAANRAEGVAVVPSLPSDAPGRSAGAVSVAMAVPRDSAGGDGGVVGARKPPAAPAGTKVGMGRNA